MKAITAKGMMMAKDEEKSVLLEQGRVWLGIALQAASVAIMLGAVVMSFGSVKSATENSAVAVEELKKLNATNAERITRVEVQIDSLLKSVDRIERKLDQPPRR